MSIFSSRKFYVVFLSSFIAALAVILIYSDKGLIKLSELQAEQIRLEKDLVLAREENRRLLEQIDRIKKDPKYIEDEARKKLGMIRPDETIYRLAHEPDLSAPIQKMD